MDDRLETHAVLVCLTLNGMCISWKLIELQHLGTPLLIKETTRDQTIGACSVVPLIVSMMQWDYHYEQSIGDNRRMMEDVRM